VAYEQRRGAVLAPQEVGGRDQVVDVRREIGICEIAFAAAQPGEIEAQYRETALGERGADRGRRLGFLGAGETVGEDGVGERRARGGVEARGERRAECAGKLTGRLLGAMRCSWFESVCGTGAAASGQG